MGQKRYISVILPLKLEWEPCYSVPENATDIHAGDRVRVIFAGKEYIAAVSATGITPDTKAEKIREICGIEHGMGRIFPEEISLWRQVASYYMCSIGEVYKAAYPVGKIHMEEAKAKADERARQREERAAELLRTKMGKLKERIARKADQLAKAKKDSTRESYAEQLAAMEDELSGLEEQFAASVAKKEAQVESHSNVLIPELSEAQTNAYNDINKAFVSGKAALIQGVTGSGKTEIYVCLAHDALKKGRNVLYMVPEIALSRQLEERLESHFGDSLLTFHSAQTSAQKRDIAEKLRNPERKRSYIILGTRSSVFLPHNNLGLVIIDEEHDSSYKQDSPAPRYHGRDTALMLARLHGADVVMGSATPSLESLYNCRCGKHALIELNERYHGSESSDIEIIDTKAERRKRGMRGSFSIKLIEHIRRTLEAGRQVLILRSRRAYSPALQCRDCGEIMKCPHCNVSLSLHRHSEGAGNTGRLVCHHCGWSADFSGRCRCSGELMLLGAGTQKIEEEAAALFPQARIARLDSDTAQNKAFEEKTIRDFSAGETDILIGTQIISKGFDFSNLSLVVIIAADTLLTMQDFRADEKAIQLMEQLRGRCGRRGEKGMFIIQTSQPQHPVYQRIISNDIKQCSIDLMQERKDFSFPPYMRIIALTVRDRYEDRAQRMSLRLAEELRKVLPGITGPYSPLPDKVADQYIRCIRISLAKDRNLSVHKESLTKTINTFEKENKYTGHISIDVDPT